MENAASLTTAPWSVLGRFETGWSVYAPLVAREVGAAGCGPDQPGFARALLTWQAAHALPPTGVMSADTLRALDRVWLGRRPFVTATRDGGCPAPPPDDLLVAARPDEGYSGKAVRLRAQAIAAYRQLVAAARAELPELHADPRLLTIVSGYRSPQEQAAKCLGSGACGTASLARCSAHRTGLALDLFLGAAPGFTPASSDDLNRATLSRSPAYRWLVSNAARFGFVPYPFEPWHWEYTRAVASPAPAPGDPPPPGGRPPASSAAGGQAAQDRRSAFRLQAARAPVQGTDFATLRRPKVQRPTASPRTS